MLDASNGDSRANQKPISDTIGFARLTTAAYEKSNELNSILDLDHTRDPGQSTLMQCTISIEGVCKLEDDPDQAFNDNEVK